MKTLRILILSLFLVLAVACGLSATYAAVPHLINYQGRLTDKSGQPLEGSYKVTLRIYDAETGPGTMTPWEEIHTNVVIQKGVFSIILGSVKPLDLVFDKPYWLEVKVGEDVMKPRQQVTSAGYALRADVSDKIVLSPEDTKPDYLNKKTGNSIKIDKASFKFDAISSAFSVFGGDGSDGDEIISKNTDISSSAKQYNNLTIEPGVTLTAKNCIIGVKGTLTVKGRISVDGGGLPGGPGTPGGGWPGQERPYNPVPGTCLSIEAQSFSTGGGGGGGGGIYFPNPGGTSGGKGGNITLNGFAADSSKHNFAKYALKEGILFCVGAGGGGGANGGGQGQEGRRWMTGGTGGEGGGALLIECGIFEGYSGSLISADGLPGGNGPGANNGGGGGGGGTVVIRCRKVTANDGVMRANGGTPGVGEYPGAGGGNPGAGGAGFTALVAIE